MTSSLPKVWELIKSFKCQCHERGWKTCENEDWIQVGNEYHNFLWTQTVHPSTFEKIALNNKCAIRKGPEYQVVDVSYTAWLFSQSPSEGLLEKFEEYPEIREQTAIYDLSGVYTTNPVCSKLNDTQSTVFKEFEMFLENKWGVNLLSLRRLSAQTI